MDENLTENVVELSSEREKQRKNVEALVRTISEDYLFHNQDNVGHVHGNEPVVPAAYYNPPDLTASALAPYLVRGSPPSRLCSLP